MRATTIYAAGAGAAVHYYAEYLTGAKGEAPGVWLGRQAASFGLAGAVGPEPLRLLLEGVDPTTADRLGAPLLDRVTSAGRLVKAVGGFDLTFSAPKSVSLLWALTDDRRLLDAHDVAVRAAVDHLERFGSTTRLRRDGGRMHVDTSGLTVAAFRQTTSRADDPQIHTHTVVAAKVQTDDGRWYALDARYLKRHQSTLGRIYQSVLRAELTHRLGVRWTDVENGQSELRGIAPKILDSFSKRTRRVELAANTALADFVRREGRDPIATERAAITRQAVLATRDSKTGVSADDLRRRWRAEAAELGVDGRRLLADATALSIVTSPRAPAPTLSAVLDQLSARGSTWSRADVMRAVCDLAEPTHGHDGAAWATSLESTCDAIMERCTDLDPPTPGLRRRSDGRSVWLEPTGAHCTRAEVLAQEERIITWAMEAQASPPWPGAVAHDETLDEPQRTAASAVAGADRLVLVSGPAGTGKTTMLRAAVGSLEQQRRLAFGLAPSAKAARILERETGMRSDTVAKLLHEWSRPDRLPEDAYRLPAGTTVVIDEAGMLGTDSLDRLIALASAERWRLVLVGDHRQVQAVGRGGMFEELVATGRVNPLQHIHRFEHRWEAAASRRLRNGDPTAVDAYVCHGRVHAGSLDLHAIDVAREWATHHAAGRSVAITATTNEQVARLNLAVQQERLRRGDIDPARTAVLAASEHAVVGDIVVTRANQRRLRTDKNEPIRNRELWTVTVIHDDGAITVSSNRGHGTVTLPAAFAHDHVALGYAATEHGNQGDTVDIGIALVTTHTSVQGLYVAATRGRRKNHLLAVTDDPGVDAARDLLGHVLANNRHDLPAVAQRRELGRVVRKASEYRAVIPSWFGRRRTDLEQELHEASADAEAERSTVEFRRAEYVRAEERLVAARSALDPYRPPIEAARERTQQAQQELYRASADRHRGRGTGRLRTNRRVDHAQQELAAAEWRQAQVERLASDELAELKEAASHLERCRAAITTSEILTEWSPGTTLERSLLDIARAMDDWRAWASGQPVEMGRLDRASEVLSGSDDPGLRGLAGALPAPEQGPELAPRMPS